MKRLAIVLLAAACGDGLFGLPAELARAVATHGCGPTDGPATVIYLGSQTVTAGTPSPPYVGIAVYRPLAELAGGSWPVAGDGDLAGAWYARSDQDIVAAADGSVTVTGVDADSTVHGWADVRFPGARRISGRFDAVWQSRTILCG